MSGWLRSFSFSSGVGSDDVGSDFLGSRGRREAHGSGVGFLGCSRGVVRETFVMAQHASGAAVTMRST